MHYILAPFRIAVTMEFSDMSFVRQFFFGGFAFVVVLAGCSDPAPDVVTQTAVPGTDLVQPVWSFVERAAESGIEFTYQNGEQAGNFSILESLGGGLATLDLDGDGREDLCFAGGGTLPEKSQRPAPPGMFRNLGAMQFVDCTEVCGISGAAFYSHGIARTDYDCDGFADFLITGYGGIQLFRNCGDGTFELIPADCGLTDTEWSSSAAWGDLNGDGFADLYVAHYVDWSWENDPFCERGPEGGREICPPRSYTGISDTLYFSNGDGSFRDVTAESKLSSEGKGLGVVLTDLDGDGDNDIYVTNDTVPNFLYQNEGTGVMDDVSLPSGASLSSLGVPDGSMGVDVCDFNRDTLPDLWVVNYERESNALYQNSGRMAFRHVSQKLGLNAVGGLFVGWGTCCVDFDSDGDEDIFVSNGHVIRYPQNAPLNQQPLLLQNDHGERLVNVTELAGEWFGRQHMGRGAVAADFDQDGDADVAVSATLQPAALLENRTKRAFRRWVSVRLSGTAVAREPVGATVILQTSPPQTGFLRGGGSYGSSVSERLLFAIPDETDIPQLEIRWPGGQVQKLTLESTDCSVMVRESDAGERAAWLLPK